MQKIQGKLLLIACLFGITTGLDYNENHTVVCQDIPSQSLQANLSYLWPRLILHEIDRYFILICCPIAFLLQLLVLINYCKFPSLMSRPGNIFFGLVIIQMILNLRLLTYGAYMTVNTQYQPTMPSDFVPFCMTIATITGFFVIVHTLYLLLFLLYVIFLFRFSLKKSKIYLIPESQTFWRVLHLGIILVSAAITGALWLEDFLGLNSTGLCGISLARKSRWNIVLPSTILAIALLFSLLGSFTYFYFHKHMPNTAGFQRKKFNESKIIGLYVVGFSLYITLIGVFGLITSINCQNSTPNPDLTVFATVTNLMKIFEFYFLIFLIMKNSFFRYKLKRMLKGIFQKRAQSDLSHYQQEIKQIQELTFDEKLLQIKQEAREIDLLNVSQIFTIISAVHVALIEYFKDSAICKIKPIHYREKIIFNIDNLSIMNYDMEVRLLSKIKILQCDMIIHSPKIFKNLLAMDGLEDVEKSFELFENSNKIYNLLEGKGGKSGEFFFFSADNKFLIKTITPQEFQFLSNYLEVFYEYYIQNPHSLLAKIYGLFTIKGNQIQRTYRFILMKNLYGCQKKQVKRTYDMKGSKYDRQVVKRSRDQKNIQNKTLKDTDFMNFEGKIKVDPRKAVQLKEILRKDSLFLKSLNLIDYSLLLIKVQWQEEPENSQFWTKYQRIPSAQVQNEYYHLGLIDYMQKWDLHKMGEKWWKNLIGKKQVSAEEPNRYQQRFMIFIEEISTVLALNNVQLQLIELQSLKKKRQETQLSQQQQN